MFAQLLKGYITDDFQDFTVPPHSFIRGYRVHLGWQDHQGQKETKYVLN